MNPRRQHVDLKGPYFRHTCDIETRQTQLCNGGLGSEMQRWMTSSHDLERCKDSKLPRCSMYVHTPTLRFFFSLTRQSMAGSTGQSGSASSDFIR